MLRQLYSSRSGSALAELALVLPLILTIFLGGVELTRVLRVYQSMANVAREAGKLAYKKCYPESMSVDMVTCLNRVLNGDPADPRSNIAQHVLPDVFKGHPAVVTLSMFRNDASESDLVRSVVVSTDSPTNPTRYTEARVLQEISAFSVELQLSPPNIGTIKPPVIIAEIFYQYTPLIPFTSRLINIPLLYETAIY